MYIGTQAERHHIRVTWMVFCGLIILHWFCVSIYSYDLCMNKLQNTLVYVHLYAYIHVWLKPHLSWWSACLFKQSVESDTHVEINHCSNQPRDISISFSGRGSNGDITIVGLSV